MTLDSHSPDEHSESCSSNSLLEPLRAQIRKDIASLAQLSADTDDGRVQARSIELQSACSRHSLGKLRQRVAQDIQEARAALYAKMRKETRRRGSGNVC